MNPEILLSQLAQMSGEDVLAVSEQHLGRAATARDPARAGKVAIIPVNGALFPKSFKSFWGGSYEGMDALRARIAQAASDADVSAIVLDMDSPGGTVAGTAETAAVVAAAAERKPVVAVANSLAASAAYWIAAQASEVVMAPAAMTGSVGVIAMHQNVAKALDRMGVETTLITSGARKAEGNPFGPLSDTAREAMQARVNEAADAFMAAVASGRKMSLKAVRDKAGDGQVMSASEALSAGLADRVATLDQVVAELSAGKGRVWRRRSALAFV